MTLNNILMLVIIVGVGYWMFRKGGGCCGSHGSHKGHHENRGENSSRERQE